MTTEPNDPEVPQADSVRWLGMCPCGCGVFKVALIDEHDEVIATFGFSEEGWVDFMRGVLHEMDHRKGAEWPEREHKH